MKKKLLLTLSYSVSIHVNMLIFTFKELKLFKKSDRKKHQPLEESDT